MTNKRFQDFTVSRRDGYEIEHLAISCRRLTTTDTETIVDPLEAFRAVLNYKNMHVDIRKTASRQLNGALAVFDAKRKRLLISDHVWDGLHQRHPDNGELFYDPYAGMTLFHELGHVVMHYGSVVPLNRMSQGNVKEPSIPVDESAEHQANTFMRCFAMSRENILMANRDAITLALLCNVPSRQAELRIRLEDKLYGARHSLTRSGGLVHRGEADILPAKVKQLWNNLERASGNDPESVRLTATGVPIHRRDYENNRSQFGWTVRDGQIVSIQDLGRDV